MLFVLVASALPLEYGSFYFSMHMIYNSSTRLQVHH